MCSEVERFWFVFFDLCLRSYGEPMLMGLHCKVVHLSLSSFLFIYFCIHWLLYMFIIFVYMFFIIWFVDVNVSVFFFLELLLFYFI